MSPSFFIQRLRHEELKRENAGPVVDAHKHCSRHGEELARSDRAGCFYCLAVFNSAEISEWVDEGGDGFVDAPRNDSTAICPKCGIDSVIGDASGFPVTDESFLREMNKLWFQA